MKYKMKNKKIIIFLILNLIIINLFSCNKINKEKNISFFSLDTVVNITIWSKKTDEEIDRILNGAKDKIIYFENLFSKTINSSDVYNINNNFEYNKEYYRDRTQEDKKNRKENQISKWTAFLLSFSKEIGEITEDAFDIKIKKLVDIWDKAKENKKLPDDNIVHYALDEIKHSDFYIMYKDKNGIAHNFYKDDNIYKKIKNNIDNDYIKYIDEIDDNVKFYIINKNSEIDLGGIAKGFIADYIKYYLLKNEIESGIINLGGNVLVIGSKNGNDFNIGIKKPFTSDIIDVVKIKNKSVVTSGVYERYFKIDNDERIYHHILNTKTGYPTDNDLYSVSVISNTSIMGDVLSTAMIVLGDENKDVLNKLKSEYNIKDLQLIYIDKNYNKTMLLTEFAATERL